MEVPLWIRSLRVLLAVLAGGAVLFALLRFGGVRPHELALIQLAVAAMGLMWGVLLLAGGAAPPRNALKWVILLAAGYGWFRVGMTGWDYTGRQEFAHFGMIALFFLAVGAVLANARTQRIALAFLITLATAVALYALVQYFLKSDRIMEVIQPSSYRGRASGTLVNPNHGAFLMSVGLLLALPLTLLGRGSPTQKILLGYAVLACAGGVVATFSRGAWAGCAAALLFVSVWMIWKERPRWLGVVMMALVLSTGLLVGGRALEKIRAQGRDDALDVRFTAIWPAAVKIWQEAPWLGAGPGRFADEFRRFRPAQLNIQSEPQRAHNDYLNILADWGAIGGGLLLAAVIALALEMYRRFREGTAVAETGRSNRRALAAALGAASIYVLVHEGSDFHLYVPLNALLMAVLAALVAAPSEVQEDKSRQLRPRMRLVVARICWCVFGVGGAGLLAAHAVPAQQEARHLQAARANSQSADEVLPHLVRAWRVQPDNPDTLFKIGELMRQRSAAGRAGYEAEGWAAVAWLRRALAANPRQPHYWIALGRTLHWLDEMDGARESFQTALKLDPHNYRVQAFYGWYLFEAGNYVKSYQWITRSLFISYHDNPVAVFYQDRVVNKLKAEKLWPVEGVQELKYRNPDF